MDRKAKKRPLKELTDVNHTVEDRLSDGRIGSFNGGAATPPCMNRRCNSCQTQQVAHDDALNDRRFYTDVFGPAPLGRPVVN